MRSGWTRSALRNRVAPVVGLLLLVAGAVAGCGTGAGTVQVFVEAEGTIRDGIDPGTGAEQIVDGWTVRYSKYIVGVGNFHAHRSAEPRDRLAETQLYLVDLRELPAGGLSIATFDGVTAASWDKVGYELVRATAQSKVVYGTAQSDVGQMVENHWSLWIAGAMTKPDGQSCKPTDPKDCVAAEKITFSWGIEAATSFDDCGPPTGDSGFAVPSGGTVQVKPTIHGDHWFFTNITQGAEITKRRAQWIADCDLDRDGETTLAEMKQVRAADVFAASRYNLSGAIIPITSGYDYFEAQARTLGDFQGDGECPTRAKL